MKTELSTYEKLAEAVAHLRSQFGQAPPVAFVLGSGLGAFAEQLTAAVRVRYESIPHFPVGKVSGHAAELVVGKSQCGECAVLSGRAHYYEGHSLDVIVHPVRTLALWGTRSFVITNSAGGVSPLFKPGDLMLITDHINLTGENPLRGQNDDRLGPRFPDMSHAYDPQISERLLRDAKAAGLQVQSGVYMGLSGPTYETPAEIRMIRTLGGDAVGMSTVPEVIALNHMARRCVGISTITNMASGMTSQKLNHAEVKETADRVRDRLIALLHMADRAIREADARGGTP